MRKYTDDYREGYDDGYRAAQKRFNLETRLLQQQLESMIERIALSKSTDAPPPLVFDKKEGTMRISAERHLST